MMLLLLYYCYYGCYGRRKSLDEVLQRSYYCCRCYGCCYSPWVAHHVRCMVLRDTKCDRRKGSNESAIFWVWRASVSFLRALRLNLDEWSICRLSYSPIWGWKQRCGGELIWGSERRMWARWMSVVKMKTLLMISNCCLFSVVLKDCWSVEKKFCSFLLSVRVFCGFVTGVSKLRLDLEGNSCDNVLVLTRVLELLCWLVSDDWWNRFCFSIRQ